MRRSTNTGITGKTIGIRQLPAREGITRGLRRLLYLAAATLGPFTAASAADGGAPAAASQLTRALDHAIGDSHRLAAVLALCAVVIVSLVVTLVRRKRQLTMSRTALSAALTGHNMILSNLPDAVWLKDTDGVYLACNPAFERLYGAPEAEIIGRTDFDFVDTAVARAARKTDRAAIAAGQTVEHEEWVTFAYDGHSALILVTKMPMYDQQGALLGVLGIAREVTDQRKTELALRQRESYQKALLDNFPFMVWLKDTEGRFLAANQGVAKLAGRETAEELIGATDDEIWPRDLAAAYRADDLEVMTKRRQKETIEEVTDGGGRIWVETYKAPVLGDRGVVLGTVGFARDVSERMATEQSLRDSERRFRAFFERNSSVMLLVDPVTGEIVDANRAATDFYGYDAAQLKSLHIGDINTRKLEAVAAACAAARCGECNQFLFQHRLACGELRDVEVFATPISSGGRELLFSIVHDVTERRQAESALARERDLFSAGPVVVFSWAPAHNWPVRYVSSNAEAVLGYTREQLTDPAFGFTSLIHPDDRDRVTREVRDFVAQGVDRFEQSYRLLHASGDYAWFHDFTQVSRGHQGEVVAIQGYLFDQTEQRRLEVSLNEQRERLQRVLEGTRAGTWEWNVQTGETRFNARWAEIIGYTLDELAPLDIHTWEQHMHPEDLKLATALLQQHFARQTGYYEAEVRMRHKDGSWVWVLDRGRVFEWTADGKPLWMAGTHQDITEHKQAEHALSESEARLRIAGRNTYDVIYEWDVEHQAIEWYGEFDDLLGYQDRELPRNLEDWLQLVHPDDRPAVQAALLARQTEAEPYQLEYRIRHKSGAYRVWLDKASPLTDSHDRPYRWVGACSDITQRMQAAEQQRLAATVFSHALEGILITNAEGDIVDVNDAFTRITGYSREEALGENPRMLRSGRQGKAFYQAMWDRLRTEGQWSGEVWNRRKDGELYAELLSISAVYGDKKEIQHFVGLFSDITAQKTQQRQLEHIAYYDPLTDLPNRVLLHDRLQRAMVQAVRREHVVALVYLDLDGFKDINDRLGHDVGDQVLIEVAKRTRRTLRDEDTVARQGGDEFVAVLGDLPDTIAAIDLLPRLLAAISRPMEIDGHTLQVSASLGVTFFPQSVQVDAQQLVREADQAMYQAKIAGKNRYYVFDGGVKRGIRSNAAERLISESG